MMFLDKTAMSSGKFTLASKLSGFQEYRKYRARSVAVFIALIALLILIALLALRAGSYDASLWEIVRAIFGDAGDSRVNTVVRNIRMPRVLTAIIGGMGLGMAQNSQNQLLFPPNQELLL